MSHEYSIKLTVYNAHSSNSGTELIKIKKAKFETPIRTGYTIVFGKFSDGTKIEAKVYRSPIQIPGSNPNCLLHAGCVVGNNGYLRELRQHLEMKQS
jgi:hypothetical protein